MVIIVNTFFRNVKKFTRPLKPWPPAWHAAALGSVYTCTNLCTIPHTIPWTIFLNARYRDPILHETPIIMVCQHISAKIDQKLNRNRPLARNRTSNHMAIRTRNCTCRRPLNRLTIHYDRVRDDEFTKYPIFSTQKIQILPQRRSFAVR
jgi:hypothetical protein